MTTDIRRPQLHWSGLDLLSKCGIAFERRYILKDRRPPTSYLHVGKGVDRAANKNLNHKIDTDQLLPVEEVVDTARDAVRQSIDEGGLALTPDEAGMSERAAADGAVDKAVRLARGHAKLVAPRLRPKMVQTRWSMEIPGMPFELVGERDLLDQDDAVRDLKTSKKSPVKMGAEQSDQLTTYALASYTIEGNRLPITVALDTVVDLQTGVKAVTLKSTRDMGDFAVLLRRIERAALILEKGAFMPARQTDWWCSTSWCEYAPTCEFFRQPKSVVIEGGK